jgi:hypothetical protein
MVIFVGSLSSFLLGISGGATNSWSSATVLAPLITGGCGLIFYVSFEVYIARDPMLALAAFEGNTAKIAYFNSFVLGIGSTAALYYLIIYVSSRLD